MQHSGFNEDLRQLEHLAPIGFAFLLRYLSWPQAIAMAVAALAYALFISPRIETTTRPDEFPSGFSSGKVSYALSVLGMLLVFRTDVFIAAAVWANLSVGDAVSNVIGRRLGRARLPWNPDKTWAGTCAAGVASALAAFTLILWTGLPVDPAARVGTALVYAITTSIVCSLAETIPLPIDDNLTITIAGSTFLAWLTRIQFPAAPAETGPALALALPVVLGLAAYGAGTVTLGGCGAGIALGTVVCYSFGIRGFALLAFFFVLGSMFSRLGYSRKAAEGIAQPNRGRRSVRNVLGKGFAPFAAAVAGLFVETRDPAAIAYTAAVAAGLYDTTATELGQLWGRRTILLTSFKTVARGTPGGVSFAGSGCGLVAGAATVALAYSLGMIEWTGGAAALIAAAIAVHLEGYLAAASESPARPRPTGELMNAFHTSLAMIAAPLVAGWLA